MPEWATYWPNGRCPPRIARPGGSKPLWRVAEDATIREYAESLITLLGAVELVVALKTPNFGFRALSEFFTRQGLQYSLKTGRPFPWLICTWQAFNAEWRARCSPLQLAPLVTAGSPPSSGHSWPIASWVNYVQSHTALRECMDWSRPLMFAVRGDAFPCARERWSHLDIALVNHGARTHQPAHYWVIGMAVCGNKDMAQPGAIWRDNLHVWL